MNMDKLWVPLTIGIAFYGLFKITNRLALYHLIESYLIARTRGRGQTKQEFAETIDHLKSVVIVNQAA